MTHTNGTTTQVRRMHVWQHDKMPLAEKNSKKKRHILPGHGPMKLCLDVTVRVLHLGFHIPNQGHNHQSALLRYHHIHESPQLYQLFFFIITLHQT